MDELVLLAEDNSVGSNLKKRELFIRQFANHFLSLEGVGVLLVDSDFNIVEISEMICSMFGCSRIDIIDKPIENWFESISLHPEPFDRSLLEGGTFRNRVLNWKVDKASYKLMMDGEVLRGNGEVVGAFVLFRDVSHLMVMDEQMRNSDRLKTIGEIAAGTAHEIRNPLTAIKGFMQLLNKKLMERSMSKEQEFISIMLLELERVNDLVSEFLLLSKPKGIDKVSIGIGRVLQEILPMIQSESLLHNVSLQYYPEPMLYPVLADRGMLKQIFLNLAKNAIEAMTEGGTLIIRECYDPNKANGIVVEICDTGTGISADDLKQVFNPFFTTKPQGTGLGLSVCMKIIHDLNGSIEVSSSKSGTKFTVWLPYAEKVERELYEGGGARSSDDV
ncbi:nitrogen regulation protein NR(II) [Cohnella sp. WQ 127256]|uniref:two-component system sensor histidine kinase NtrB n=1 Tax=Cohnella sp. WQ 127256 TaxID=2938790 RepID=UPI00211756B5|nr:ATP-binding protein [Cohnella sp. WQ 127256]